MKDEETPEPKEKLDFDLVNGKFTAEGKSSTKFAAVIIVLVLLIPLVLAAVKFV